MSPKAKASGAPHLHLGDVRGRSRPGQDSSEDFVALSALGFEFMFSYFGASGFRFWVKRLAVSACG